MDQANLAFAAAKLDLENQVALYQFHVGSYTKGIAFFLAINAVLFKFALDDESRRLLYSIVAILCGAAILIPLGYGLLHSRRMKVRFDRLAELTRTDPIDVTPLQMLVQATAAFWVIILGTWMYMVAISLK